MAVEKKQWGKGYSNVIDELLVVSIVEIGLIKRLGRLFKAQAWRKRIFTPKLMNLAKFRVSIGCPVFISERGLSDSRLIFRDGQMVVFRRSRQFRIRRKFILFSHVRMPKNKTQIDHNITGKNASCFEQKIAWYVKPTVFQFF